MSNDSSNVESDPVSDAKRDAMRDAVSNVVSDATRDVMSAAVNDADATRNVKSGAVSDAGGTGQARVRDNDGASRYEMAVPGVAGLAVLDYMLTSGEPGTSGGASAGNGHARGRGSMIFTHTFVPDAMRGKGVAEMLVRAGLAGARERGRSVVAECSYVARFIERHAAEYGDLLAK